MRRRDGMNARERGGEGRSERKKWGRRWREGSVKRGGEGGKCKEERGGEGRDGSVKMGGMEV